MDEFLSWLMTFLYLQVVSYVYIAKFKARDCSKTDKIRSKSLKLVKFPFSYFWLHLILWAASTLTK